MHETTLHHKRDGFDLNRHHHFTIKAILSAFIDPTPRPPSFLANAILSQDTQQFFDVPFDPPQRIVLRIFQVVLILCLVQEIEKGNR